jgi:hypothetical protein
MPLSTFFSSWSGFDQDPSHAYRANNAKLKLRLQDVLFRAWDLGFTAFGGPPVHFRIFYGRFVACQGKIPWVDEQTVSCLALRPLLAENLNLCSIRSSFPYLKHFPDQQARRCCFALLLFMQGYYPLYLFFCYGGDFPRIITFAFTAHN